MFKDLNIEGTNNEEGTKIYRVLTAKILLSADCHQTLLQKIEISIATSKVRYDLIYKPLINNFAELVQTMPDIGKRADYQLLNIGLERAFAISSDYIKNNTSPNYLYVYAIFSAALLLDVGRLNLTRNIDVCNKSGIFLKEWQPIIGKSLIESAVYYKVRSSFSSSEDLSQLMTSVIARSVMPEIGLLCMLDDSAVLAWWLKVLSYKDDGKDEFANDFRIYNDKFRKIEKLSALERIKEQYEIDKKHSAAEKFLRWLQEQVRKEEIKINEKNSSVHKLKDGVVIDIETLARKFSSIYSDKFPSWTVIVQQFNSLGIAKMSGGDYKFEQFFGKKTVLGSGGHTSIFSGAVSGKSSSGQLIFIDNARNFLDTRKYGISSNIKVYGAPTIEDKITNKASSLYGLGINSNLKNNPGLNSN